MSRTSVIIYLCGLVKAKRPKANAKQKVVQNSGQDGYKKEISDLGFFVIVNALGFK